MEALAQREDQPVATKETPLLEVRDVSVRFGGIAALQDVNFSVARGTIAGLIGPNGAGKTTLFNCMSRLYKPSTGEIIMNGQPLGSVARHRIAALGVGRTFQHVALFDKMSVLDNVMVGGHLRGRTGFLGQALQLPRVREEERVLAGHAREIVEFMGLEAWCDRVAGGLPFPIRKRVELARTLMARPQLVLLDEPAAGLNHEEVELLATQIREIRDRFGATVLLVEHHMALVMGLSDQVIALNFGRKIADDTPAQVQRDPAVIEAYLGEED